ncbi:MAG: PrsW family intramembrane metalloprotease [Bacteroidetes bacterium]|nr:PrsW family intramembrane metalloprotease [Bacteroidota bacterium]
MSDSKITLFFMAFAAIVSATMWIDYFRRIDVFEREKIWPLITALIIGCCTPSICLFFYSLLHKAGIGENGKFLNDFLYAIFGVGLNEEFSKIIGVVVVITIFRKKIDEPIDYLIYAGVVAIGFAMIENFKYFSLYGIKVITPRTFYSSLEHIINTTLIVYGFYRYKLFKKGKPVVNVLVASFVAIASHGLFDFFLMDTSYGYLTAFFSIMIYLIGINFWVQMLNNANNFSSFFDYDKIHYTYKIFLRLLFWYSLTIVITFVNNIIVSDLRTSVSKFFFALFSDGFLFWVVMLRVSRFKIYKQKYFNLKIQFPFYITKNKDEDLKIPFLNIRIKVRGENYMEHIPTKYIDKSIIVCPVNSTTSFLNIPVNATITNKYLLFDDVVVYSVVFNHIGIGENNLFLLKPKTRGRTEIDGIYPVEGLYKVNNEVVDLSKVDIKSLKLLEWVYLKV